jgi:hypothetical protein
MVREERAIHSSAGVRQYQQLDEAGIQLRQRFCLASVLVPDPHERISGDGLPTAMAVTVHSSQPIHRDDVSRRRTGNDRVAGPGVDREVKRISIRPPN